MSDSQEIQPDENQTPWWRRKHQLAGLALGIGVGTTVGASSSTLISGILVGVAIIITFGVAYNKATEK
jgi:hypothetical protein